MKGPFNLDPPPEYQAGFAVCRLGRVLARFLPYRLSPTALHPMHVQSGRPWQSMQAPLTPPRGVSRSVLDTFWPCR